MCLVYPLRLTHFTVYTKKILSLGLPNTLPRLFSAANVIFNTKFNIKIVFELKSIHKGTKMYKISIHSNHHPLLNFPDDRPFILSYSFRTYLSIKVSFEVMEIGNYSPVLTALGLVFSDGFEVLGQDRLTIHISLYRSLVQWNYIYFVMFSAPEIPSMVPL